MSRGMECEANILGILKELQRASKLQQQQIDHLITAVELRHHASPLVTTPATHAAAIAAAILAPVAGTKRPAPEPQEEGFQEQEEVTTPQPVDHRKEHLDKILDKPSFKAIWERIKVHLDTSRIGELRNRDQIVRILQDACEKAKLACAMGHNNLASGGTRRVSKLGPDVKRIRYTVTCSPNPNRVNVAHNLPLFESSLDDFKLALDDHRAFYRANPRPSLLSESSFSSTTNPEFRSKRQRLPFAVCCIRKPGLLSFFVGDWAFPDKDMPNSSILVHYATLQLDKFVPAEELASAEWTAMEEFLREAACPDDAGIGSVSMFMHLHRGNIVCGKVTVDKRTDKQALRLYPHYTCKGRGQGIFLQFNDSGKEYEEKLGEADNVVVTAF